MGPERSSWSQVCKALWARLLQSLLLLACNRSLIIDIAFSYRNRSFLCSICKRLRSCCGTYILRLTFVVRSMSVSCRARHFLGPDRLDTRLRYMRCAYLGIWIATIRHMNSHCCTWYRWPRPTFSSVVSCKEWAFLFWTESEVDVGTYRFNINDTRVSTVYQGVVMY